MVPLALVGDEVLLGWSVESSHTQIMWTYYDSPNHRDGYTHHPGPGSPNPAADATTTNRNIQARSRLRILRGEAKSSPSNTTHRTSSGSLKSGRQAGACNRRFRNGLSPPDVERPNDSSDSAPPRPNCTGCPRTRHRGTSRCSGQSIGKTRCDVVSGDVAIGSGKRNRDAGRCSPRVGVDPSW